MHIKMDKASINMDNSIIYYQKSVFMKCVLWAQGSMHITASSVLCPFCFAISSSGIMLALIFNCGAKIIAEA